MPRFDDPDEPFYFDEVIGSAMSYHRPTCHIIRLIRRRNYKRLRDWKEASRLGLTPCPHCRPPSGSEVGASPPKRSPLTASELGDLRRALMSLLDAVEPGPKSSAREGVAARIHRLSKADIIPRNVAVCMLTITEARNAAEYEAKTSQAIAYAVEGALYVIREWARESGLTLPSGLGAQ